jgi:hypothetical protein
MFIKKIPSEQKRSQDMSSENLLRTSYRIANNPDDPMRPDSPSMAENERDMDQYYRPLERIHGSSLHGWGVASGLGVTATFNSATPNLTIQPGVALDSNGQHISLAPPSDPVVPSGPVVPSFAEVGSSPTGFYDEDIATLVPVTSSGVVMPTTNLTGDKYLTIQFWETFDSTGHIVADDDLIYLHTPWVQLVDVADFTNDGKRVVLAKVSFAASPNAGQITALTQGLRQATDMPVGSVHLKRIVTSSPSANVETVDTAEAGAIRAYTTGGLSGLDITVPNKSDVIHLERDDGGNFAKVSLGAEQIVARQGTGTESVVIDTEAGSLTASGTITGGSISTSGGVTASSATVNGPISARSITASGAVTAGGATVNGPISARSLTASGNVSGSSGIFGPSTWAGTFYGNVVVNGVVTKGGGGFKIDHPLDPANKYLSHSFVESPDMKNIYDGVALLDEHGEAVVELPVWFEALNTEFRYQLTCLGGYAPVYIAEQVRDHRFKIAGGEPGMEVSWQLTGIRRDAWANAHRLGVEEDKPEEEQGFYLHPELYGASREQHVFAVRHPELAALLTVPGQETEEER